MNQVTKNFDLNSHNTFRVSGFAQNFAIVNSTKDLQSLLTDFKNEPIFILGSGANILLTKDIPGLTIKLNLLGRKILGEDKNSVTVEVSAGEDWHDLVMYSVGNGWSGIENLALIPGTVGAAPVQNLAAYGQNVGDVIQEVKGISPISPVTLITLKHSDLKLYYRDSIFKHELKDKFIITSVTIKLSKTAHFDTSYHSRYESLEGELSKFTKPPYQPKDIVQAVINLRTVKMPDWRKIGTAGSFFKNPFVSKTKYTQLVKLVKDLQVYPVNAMLYPNPDDPVFKMSDMVKIPAGRLLDELGWKGKRIGNIGTFEKHALVIVNYGGATGTEILEFSQKMQEAIKKNFDIDLEPEVNII